MMRAASPARLAAFRCVVPRDGLALGRRLSKRFGGPNTVSILTFLSYSLTTGVIFGWSNDPPAWLTEARELAERAANLDENDAWVQCVLGLGQFTAKQPDKAIGHYRKAIALNPSFALGHGYLALQLAFMVGRTDEAIKEAEMAIRLSPRDPELYHRARRACTNDGGLAGSAASTASRPATARKLHEPPRRSFYQLNATPIIGPLKSRFWTFELDLNS